MKNALDLAVDYARFAAKAKEAPKYVKKQAKEFLKIAENKSKKYKIDDLRVNQITAITKLLIMPRGLKAGRSIYECSTGYQWLFYVAVLAVVFRSDKKRRRYQTAVLEIARKNFKTFTIGTIFILLLLIEPRFSKFYSVAPDGDLSREVKSAITELLKSSPLVYEFDENKRFKILRDYIECNVTESVYKPLNYSTNRMDGKLPNAFLADEVGALPNSNAIEAMRSGQINILNKLGCIISTKYKTASNPFEDEVDYCKRVLDEIEDDETVFALLFEPDNCENWMTDDLILKQANPAAIESAEIWDDLIKKRQRAIAVPSARENFLTKHCNIIYQGFGTESFVDITDLKKCCVKKIDWSGKVVYVGVDLAMTNDNVAVSFVSSDDDNNILIESMAFIPEGRIEEKTRTERCDYRQFIEAGKCIACGNKTVDYAVIEQFVFDIEKTYGCEVNSIGFDRFNALSSAQKWQQDYTVVEVRQHSDTLHPVTKLLSERIANGKVRYSENKLLEINFENAKCTYDTNMNRYVNKKKSNGKVDIVMSILDALYSFNIDVILSDDSGSIQII